MKLISFPEQTTVFAKDQPAYEPLLAYRFKDPERYAEGRIVCCWQLSWKERLSILFTGRVWHQILTFNHPLQPQLLSVEKPVMEICENIGPRGRRNGRND